MSTPDQTSSIMYDQYRKLQKKLKDHHNGKPLKEVSKYRSLFKQVKDYLGL